jgi:hypothetical protein
MSEDSPHLTACIPGAEGLVAPNDFTKIMFSNIERNNVLPLLDQHEINNLWLPLPKQTLRRLLNSSKHQSKYEQQQQGVLSKFWPTAASQRWHLAFEDGDEMLHSLKILGEGGFGLVDEVILDTRPARTVCVRKRIGRPTTLNGQKKLFEAFRREVEVMRQVSHHHCVELIGSYTDYESVSILSLPVADMDLATFLDSPDLDPAQKGILRLGIGCLCGALSYLHGKYIR